MIPGLLALLGCQLLGEFVVRLIDVPVPGPVVGMVLLLGWLQVREPDPEGSLVRVMEGLLKHMQLLFVPAGVGVVQYLSLIGSLAVPLTVGLLVSWLVGLLAAALTAAALLSVQSRLRRTPGALR